MKKLLLKHKTVLSWLTLLILTNCLTVFFLINGMIQIPGTLVLKNDSNEFLTEINKLNTLNNVINRRYIGDLDNKALGENLVDTMFSFLGDQYSEYYTSDEYSEILNSYSSTFGGIGVEIDSSDPNIHRIIRPIPGSPAEAAGVQAEDIIIKVNGEDVRNQDIDLVVSKTRGEIGTEVTLTVDRGGQEIDFTLKRDKIDNNTVYSDNIDGIGYIYISSFGNGTARQFQEKVDELMSQNITDLIVDIRSNGGGIVDSAVGVADILLDKETIGYALDKNGNRENFNTKDGKIDIPFVVLVDENTASASELIAGAFLEEGIPVIGKKTFGKGVIQAMSNLKDGSGFKLTFQEYFLKDGQKVNKIGITPSIEVDLPQDLTPEQTLDRSNDTQLQKALEILKNN